MLTIENASRAADRFLDTIPPYTGAFHGRGIVTCAGGAKYLTCAWVLIKMLRHLGCTLPIEVWYLGEGEGDPEWIKLVEPLGVTCIDAREVARRATGSASATHPHPLGGWQSKPFAILHSRFQEILFLDADNVPVVDPTFLFEAGEYRRTGAIFWPDGIHTPRESVRWQIFGIPYRDESEQESGQIVIDKQRCWRALNLTDWYNRHSDFFYNYVYGDKDTFRLAWHKVGQPYAMPARYPDFIPFAMCQYDFCGELLFQHRVHDKWSLLGNRRVSQFRHESTCFAFVDELAQTWSPVKYFYGRDKTPRDKPLEESLGGRRFEFEYVGANRWPMELGARGCIDVGGGALASFWWCTEGRVILAGPDGKPLCRMSRKDGYWEGFDLRNPLQPYRLLPLNE